VLHAYFDESYREHRDVFLVAGALFYPKRATRFGKHWAGLFPEGFHAAKFNAPCHNKSEEIERDRRLNEGAKLLARDIELASIVVCSADEAGAAFGGGNAQARAYLACGGTAAFAMAYFLKDRGRPERIAYTYDEGRRGEATRSLEDLFNRIRSRDDLREIYRHVSQTTADARDNVWLQAADYLAWEFGFYETTGRTDRKNMRTLVNGLGRRRRHDRIGFYYSHKTLDSLREFADWLDGLRAYVPEVDGSEPLP
jgi:hypothetical protein